MCEQSADTYKIIIDWELYTALILGIKTPVKAAMDTICLRSVNGSLKLGAAINLVVGQTSSPRSEQPMNYASLLIGELAASVF
jgi:hypothetical protein